MIKIVLNGKPKPKPAGCIKYSHGRAYISMDVRGYTNWKKSHIKTLTTSKPKIPLNVYGIVYNVVVPNRQRLGDLTNITNAIQDILVDSQILPDDSTRWVNKVYEVLTVNASLDYYVEVYLTENRSEFSSVIYRFL